MTIDAPLDAAPPSAVAGQQPADVADPADAAAGSPFPTRSRCSAATLVAVAETSYIGRLGTEPLAGDRAGVSVRHADADDVGGRDGRRRLLRHQPRARRRQSRARRDAGAARRHHRRLRRIVLHRDDAGLRPRSSLRCWADAAACSNSPCNIRRCCFPARSRSGWSIRWPRCCAAPATCACRRRR